MTLGTEKAFHNKRFEGGDSRKAQLKYYWAIRSGSEKYCARVSELASRRLLQSIDEIGAVYPIFQFSC
jgi:hypothetical protein